MKLRKNLWIDDLRDPEDWVLVSANWDWAKTSKEGIATFQREEPFSIISFDHDLGGLDSTRPVIMWMIAHEVWPTEAIHIHSYNPIGVEWISNMVLRYGPFESTLDGRKFTRTKD